MTRHTGTRPLAFTTLLATAVALLALGLLSPAGGALAGGPLVDEAGLRIAPPGPDALSSTSAISHPIVIPFPPGWPLFPCYGPGSMPFPTPVGAPTRVPRPTPTPGPATSLTYRLCPQLARLVPATVQAQVASVPWDLYGYGMLRNPNVPYHPVWNTYRTWISLLDYGKPWGPCNPVVLKSGCP
jgi:hypothetical protein